MEEVKLEPIESEQETDASLLCKEFDESVTDNFVDVKPCDLGPDHPEPFFFVKQEYSENVDLDVGQKLLKDVKDEKPEDILEGNDVFIKNYEDCCNGEDVKEENCGKDGDQIENEDDSISKADDSEPVTIEREVTEGEGNTQVLSLQCETCDFKTRNLAELNSHVRSHYQQFEHKCPRCRYSTPLEFCLKRHLDLDHSKPKKKHPCYTNEDGSKFRNKSCTHCEFKTHTERSLRSHIKYVHMKFRHYCCHICDYGSQSKGRLERHLASVHLKIKSYSCNSCDFKTNRIRSLRSHMRRIHEIT